MNQTPGGGEEVGRVLVVIPTYNEAPTVEKAVGRLRTSVPGADVLVVDDASPDGTGRIVSDLAAVDEHVNLLARAGKQGLGSAYVAGFRWGLERGYDVLVEMDADGSHQPEELPHLLAALADADLVIGSRYVPGGSVVNWPRRREVLSRTANRYANLALGMGVADATGGYRVFRASTLRAIALDEVASQGYCFQVDLTWRTVRRGLDVTEVPITFVEREEGQSKMSGAVVREALVRVTEWGVRHRWGQLRGLIGIGGQR
jgi:dolichol-phosphate mannosyltransferase